ncbi:MAG: hypothetical protein ACPG4T_03125 [Nannocystaceae bacterium]
MAFVTTLLTGALALTAGITALNFHVQAQPKQFERERPQRDCRQILVDALRDDPALCTANAVLLGSSRTKALADLHVGDTRFLNLACDDMAPTEFPAYVDYFVDRCGREPETIAVALDFYGSSTHRVSVPNPPSYYIEKSRNLSYRLGLYDALSVDQTLETFALLRDPHTREGFSWDLLQQSFSPTPKQKKRRRKRARKQTERRVRRRQLHPTCLERRADTTTDIGPAKLPEEFRHQRYYREAYGNYQLDPRNLKALRALHNSHPDTRFAVYVTPVSHVLFSLLLEYKLVDQLETYLKALVDEFGAVTTFLYPNSITSMRANFRDENHLYRATADLVIARILGETTVNVPEDFGVELTPQTLPQHIDSLHAWAAGPQIPASRRERLPVPTSLSYAQASARPRFEGMSWSDCTLHIDEDAGLRVSLEGAPAGKVIELSLDAGDSYDVRFWRGSSKLNQTRVGPKKRVDGLAVYKLDLPASTQTVQIQPGKGDGRYSLGHLVVVE